MYEKHQSNDSRQSKEQPSEIIEEKDADDSHEPRQETPPEQVEEPPYSVLSNNQKLLTVSIASLATFLSPMSASIFYPSMEAMSHDLHVTASMINLSITTFKIFQGIAPLVTGSLSDHTGRRPTLMASLAVYIGVNGRLAAQTSYPALMVLRALQSICSSTVLVVGTATTADVVTGADRGRYMAYTVLGSTVGPALGPLIGGILTQFLGWRSAFWFLAILAGLLFLAVVFLLPETCRGVVGDGSVPAHRCNRSLLQAVRPEHHPPRRQTLTIFTNRPSPCASLKILAQRESACVIALSSVVYAAYLAITTTLPFGLTRHYGYNALQVGLCFIPYGAGSVTSRWTAGTLTDWNFRRKARRLGLHPGDLHQGSARFGEFPLESARLQIALPLVYLAAVFIVVYGWVLGYGLNVAAPLVVLFFVAHSIAGVTSTLNTLIIDCHVDQPATATAAANFCRCLLGAGSTAGALPLINCISFGWSTSLLAFVCVGVSPLGWAVLLYGRKWRETETQKTRARNADMTAD